MRSVPVRRKGFVLLPVVLLIALLATVIFLLSRENASSLSVAKSEVGVMEATYVAEAGLARATWQLRQNTSCANYTDIPTTSFGNNSYSVTVAPNSSSPVMLSAVGTLADGASQMLTRNSVKSYQPSTTLVLQPDAAGGKDTNLYQWKPAWNFGAAVSLRVENRIAGDWSNALLEFDTSSIPAAAKIVSARLELNQSSSSASGGDFSVHRVTSAWVEGSMSGANGSPNWTNRDAGVAWATAGGDFDPVAIASINIPSGIGAHQWSIEELVQDWVSGKSVNLGLAIVPASYGSDAFFSSSDSTNPTDRPKLTITFACECGQVCESGSGKLLLVVGDVSSPVGSDLDRKNLMESWGYVVTLIDDNDSQANFDDAAAVNDIIYVTASTAGTATIGDKITGSVKPIVNERRSMMIELGFSDNASSSLVSDSYSATDATHYITEPFAGSGITHFTSAITMPVPGGTLAPGLHSVASSGTVTYALPTLDAGAERWDGTFAAARRVQVPFESADISQLTEDGLTLMKRAIEWGARGPKENPIAHWKFDDGSGLTALDSEGGHDGTLLNGPAWVPGKLDTALDFDGSDDVVDVPQASDLDLSTFTVAAWIRLSSITPSQTILEKRDGADLATVNYLLLAAGNEITWAFYDGGWASFSTNAANMVVDTWYHVAGTYDNSSGEGNVYVDGVLLATGTTTKNPPLVPGSIRIGDSECSTCGNKWNGSLDDVRIYNRALSGSEVSDLYGASLGPIAHWKLDETSGTTAVDSVGGHDGTLVNGPLWAAGQDGGALDFDGANDEVTVPHSEQLSLSDAFTLMSWAKPGSISFGYQAIMFKGNSGDFNWWFGLRNGEFMMEFYAGGSLQAFATSGAGLTAGNWYHIAASFDNAADTVALYIDGVHVHTQSTTATPDINSLDLLIGNSAYSGEEWDGLLDDVRIYDSVLSATEITALANGGGGGGGGGGGSCDGTFRDEFSSTSYSNNDGTLIWATDWLEINESDGPVAGDEQVAQNSLRVQDNDSGGEGAQREANLTGAGTATLTFDYKRVGFDNANDYVTIDISANGDAGPWVELERFAGPANDTGGLLPASYDISAHSSSNTRIRFLTSFWLAGNEALRIDNVEILCTP